MRLTDARDYWMERARACMAVGLCIFCGKTNDTKALICSVCRMKKAEDVFLLGVVGDSKKSQAQRRRGEYFIKRYAADFKFRLQTLIRREFNRIKDKHFGQNGCSGIKRLGCSIDEFKAHIEKQFKDGMTWDNHGAWELDHIRPLASFDLTQESQISQACHFSNFQPLWRDENRQKSDKWEGVIQNKAAS
jgi:hypothetical protein